MNLLSLQEYAMKEIKRYIVTSALPYANGPIHIGHLAGVYLPADIYVRYRRLKGEEVLFVCGSDEHGVPITLKAKKEGVSPQAIVDKYHRLNKESFKKIGIEFDIYHRTSDPLHHQTASDFFKTLYDKGIFTVKETQQYYDEEQQQFLADRYIVGTCPKCGDENAYGDQCENCGTSLSPKDLKNPRSALSGNPPVLKKTKHWYLPLNKYEPWLKKWILKEHKKDWKTNVYGQCKSWLDQSLRPRAVTRDLDWGVPVPLAEAKNKVLYVWFDAPIGYISATKAWAKENNKAWEPWWKDEGTKLIHFIGKDNIVFHCIIFPVILKAAGEYILPDNVPANEFMNLEGDKISTSRNWAVWLHEFIKDLPGKEDVLRYTLISNLPETKDSEFTWKDFQAKNNNELVAILGNFFNRVMVLTHKYFNGIVPPGNVAVGSRQNELSEKIEDIVNKLSEAIEQYKLREALNLFMDLARDGNKYLADKEPWKLDRDDPQLPTIINNSIMACTNLTGYMQLFLPFTAVKSAKMLNMDLSAFKFGELFQIPAGTKLNKPEHLFEKIEDDLIQKQIQKLTRIDHD